MTPVLWVVLLAAAVFDIRSRRIPNPLVGVGLVLGLGAQVMLHNWQGLVQGLAGAGVALAVLIAPFALRALGAGDVKLAMVVGVWTEARTTLAVVLSTALLTGLMSLLFWIYLYFRPDTPPPKVPVAVPLFLATIALTTGLITPSLVGL